MTDKRLARVLPLVRRGRRPVCVMLAGAGGGVGHYLRLAGALGDTYNVYGVRARGLATGEEPERRLTDMAASTLDELAAADIEPEVVFGWSMGGSIGWELCVRLAAEGRHPQLIMLDSSPLPRRAGRAENERLAALVLGMLGPRTDPALADRVRATLDGQIDAVAGYTATIPYPGPVRVITCADPDPVREPSVARWRELAPHLRTAHLDAGHYAALDAEHLPALVTAMAFAPATGEPVR